MQKEPQTTPDAPEEHDNAAPVQAPVPDIPREKPDRKDFWAMLIAAFATFMPFLLFMLALLFGLLWFAFLR